ncbi:MAG: ATP-binding protein [Bradyrhizobium sp.]|nr:ATP-binding protein [Bradyrhizobium sp.]
MKSKIVLVNNVARLAEAGEALLHRAPGMPGMGLVHGETGYGKTTAVTWYVNRCNGIYVRAWATWTPAAMFSAILHELGRAARGSCAQMMGDIIEALAMSGRPLFVDEADYLADSKRMCESLRDLHDMATVPVILIGMGGIDQRLAHRKQLTGRVLADVRFHPLEETDAQKIAAELCEVRVEPDLVADLNKKAAGSVRLTVVGLERVERWAKAQGIARVSLGAWGKRAFFTGEAPGAPKPAVASLA